eukprot:CAMPEP_0195292830 /NCGR_PEP_ID=MMETSP0707-20130614/10978_1 /TAXON_ID=33640 /ORGANISM="Asterionellopsis glacialis, Strain CCMP134" /LENGTH=467 /DNA_ID=CAMNT_0040353407 /DNA_START=21 /DNA_END=1424 /DNA_ORIENTATION=-
MSSRPPVSKAKKKWALLRTALRATRRSSLTSSERSFLKAIRSKKHAKSDTAIEDSDCGVGKSRAKLRRSICAVQFALSKGEQAFLQSLVDTPEISAEQVEKAHQVLTSDPLYQSDVVTSLKENDPAVASPSLRPKLRQNDASFRKELWTYAGGDEDTNNNDTAVETLPEKDEKKHDGGNDGDEPSAEKRHSLFYFIRKSFANPCDGDKKDDDTAVTAEIEEAVQFKILGTHVDDPDCQPHVLSPPIMDALRSHFPFAVQEDNFWLKYSMMRDGASMRSLLKHVKGSARTILAIETMDGDVFGSFTSSPWRPQGREYYGSGESFLWRLKKSRYTPCDKVEEQIDLESQVEIFKWTGENRNIQSLANPDGDLILGGGGKEDDPFAIQVNDDEDNNDRGCALTLSGDLMRGSSDRSMTFKNPKLPTNDEDVFEIANVEVWTMTPVDDEEQAELLEHGRMFLFDHGNFVQD